MAGEKRVRQEGDKAASGAGEGLYWKYESFLKRLDTRFYSVVGAAGELYAIRTSLFQPVPADAILDDFEQTMAVNVRAPWLLSQLCAERWIEAGTEGCIVNISSMLSTRVAKGVSLYTMSKAAIRHLTAGHALEWAKHGIRVYALCPGYIRTSINDEFWETEQGKAELAKLPRPRVGEPQDLDSALLFLVDPRSQFVNGEALTVDDAQSWAI